MDALARGRFLAVGAFQFAGARLGESANNLLDDSLAGFGELALSVMGTGVGFATGGGKSGSEFSDNQFTGSGKVLAGLAGSTALS